MKHLQDVLHLHKDRKCSSSLLSSVVASVMSIQFLKRDNESWILSHCHGSNFWPETSFKVPTSGLESGVWITFSLLYLLSYFKHNLTQSW